MRHIRPTAELSRDLVAVQNPVRYLGGEYGQIIKESADLTFALAFPDLYEIAMSNLAIKIIYDGLNRIPSVRCERVFAPAPDFEALLKKKHLPLYTLESGIPLNETDIVGVSIGYEPGITGLLAILETGNIPLLCVDRSENDPIVLAGGCGVTNPAPFSRFIDAFFIGEAEGGMFELVAELSEMKKRGAKRSDLLAHIAEHPAVWTATKAGASGGGHVCAHRAIYADFGKKTDRAVCFPVPNMRIVHDHGVVEIMRGCPNGCRFCHAGLYYRPQRMMPIDRICSDVDYLVRRGGYREISLMSLSSGDYAGIDNLLSTLSSRYSSRNVSFQLPSLKVNSFTLPLLEKMSEVRKSGLTFAVETPVDAWQLSLNKEVYRDRIVDILLEARRRGWSKAKFYFMIGLPVEQGGQFEENEIVNFLLDIQDRTRIQCNANIGTFIPKPHTPYQWAHQLSMTETDKKLGVIHGSLPRGRFKVNSPRPFNSFVEGMMSRGDERVGDIILEAYKRGCRLDAWDDWARPDIWKSVIEEASWNVEQETIRERSLDEILPWDGVSLGASKSFLRREKERSDMQSLTKPCVPDCDAPCGICGTKNSVRLVENSDLVSLVEGSEVSAPEVSAEKKQAPEAVQRFVLAFSKRDEAAFIPHLGLLEIWHKAFQRSGLPVIFSEGFNPLPRFELASSLSLGVFSECEIASFLLYEMRDAEKVRELLNESLPPNIRIIEILAYPLSRKIRREALSQFLWGNSYRYDFYETSMRDKVLADSRFTSYLAEHLEVVFRETSSGSYELTIPFALDRPFRDLIAEIAECQALEAIRITKLMTLASIAGSRPTSFFSVFGEVSATNKKLLDTGC